jgi:3-phosphoshikimate 1-carboxyvinyltransferase
MLMTTAVITKADQLGGAVRAPPSKSYTHRMLVAALLSQGVSKLSNPLVSADTQATLCAVEAFGATIETEESRWRVTGTSLPRTPRKPIDCENSGTTARFLLPIATLARGPSTFLFGASLRKRPFGPLLTALRQLGATIAMQTSRQRINTHGGGLNGGSIPIRGDVSSQFISGLLFACPKAEIDSEITLSTPLESKGYVQMTMNVLEKHGVRVHRSDGYERFSIPSSQEYEPSSHIVPGDFSSAAFLLAAGAITQSTVKVTHLSTRQFQGDEVIVEHLKKMGADVTTGEDSVKVSGRPLHSITVDVKDMPDLVPVYAALACYSEGTSELSNARRLEYKESNRLNALHSELRKMGADITEHSDGLVIEGPCALHGATIDPHEDHRIAMACSIAALGATGQTAIQNAECVEKSYPRFFEDLQQLGAEIIGT